MRLATDINWNTVADAALGDSRDTYSFDLDTILETVFKVASRYLLKDLEELDIKGIEGLFEFPFHGRKRKGYLDLWGWNSQGVLFIRDWKSTGTLNEQWRFREYHSPQGKFYATALLYIAKLPIQPVLFECCGVDRSGNQRRFERVYDADELLAYDREAQIWESLFGQCYEAGDTLLDPWPRNAPEGCRPFGPRYPCQYEGACFGDEKIQGNLVKLEDLPSSSYSGDKEFRRCPERWRLKTLDRLAGREQVDSPEAEWGSAFHRGVAEVWRQGFGKNREE